MDYYNTISNIFDYIDKFNKSNDIINYKFTGLNFDIDNNLYIIKELIFNDIYELPVKLIKYSKNEFNDIIIKYNINNIIKKKYNYDDINKVIYDNRLVMDDRIKYISENLYKVEQYELLRLELSNYLNINTKIKNNLIKSIKNEDRINIINIL
jgi:hypothetical protein